MQISGCTSKICSTSTDLHRYVFDIHILRDANIKHAIPSECTYFKRRYAVQNVHVNL